jgi:hypothetical protein
LNRINEISFNSSLMREMRAVSFVTRLITQDRIIDNQLPRMLIHSIADDEFMGALSSTSKLNAANAWVPPPSTPHIAEVIIGRAFAPPVGSCELRCCGFAYLPRMSSTSHRA